MPPFRDLLPRPLVFPEPNAAARSAAKKIVSFAADTLTLEDDFKIAYRALWASAVEPLPGRLDGDRQVDLATRHGPVKTWTDCLLHRALGDWANATLPGDQVVSVTWGFRRPDLAFLARSADGGWHLVAATGEIKRHRARTFDEGTRSHSAVMNAAPTPAQSAQPSPPRNQSANAAWVTSMAQECLYALQTAELYGALTGVAIVESEFCRIVVSSAEGRKLIVEVHDELHEQLGHQDADLPLAEFLGVVSAHHGRVGAHDLDDGAGDVDEEALKSLWDLLVDAAEALGDADDVNRALLPPHGQFPLPCSATVVAPTDTVPSAGGAPSAAPADGSCSAPAADDSHLALWLADQDARAGLSEARSRALFPGRGSPSGSEVTSDGSIVDVVNLMDLLTTLDIRVRPLRSASFADVLRNNSGAAPDANSVEDAFTPRATPATTQTDARARPDHQSDSDVDKTLPA